MRNVVYIAISLVRCLCFLEHSAIGLVHMNSLLIGLLMALQAQSAQPASKTHRTVWDGVYTTAQATAGKAVYAKSCLHCHRSDLSGYSGVLVNPQFLEKWREDSLDALFEVIKSTMPRGAPASLPDEAYIGVVAFILQANDFPSGPHELRRGHLKNIRVEARSGPQGAPPGSLVQVIGCLSKSSDNIWILERSREPIRMRNPSRSSEDELRLWQSAPLGELRFNLMAFEVYGAASESGNKVEAKGFLIKKANEQWINLTALQTVAAECEP